MRFIACDFLLTKGRAFTGLDYWSGLDYWTAWTSKENLTTKIHFLCICHTVKPTLVRRANTPVRNARAVSVLIHSIYGYYGVLATDIRDKSCNSIMSDQYRSWHPSS